MIYELEGKCEGICLLKVFHINQSIIFEESNVCSIDSVSCSSLSSFCLNASPPDTIRSHFSIRWDCDIKSQIIGMDVGGIKSIFCFRFTGMHAACGKCLDLHILFSALIQFSLPPSTRKYVLASGFWHFIIFIWHSSTHMARTCKKISKITFFNWIIRMEIEIVAVSRQFRAKNQFGIRNFASTKRNGTFHVHESPNGSNEFLWLYRTFLSVNASRRWCISGVVGAYKRHLPQLNMRLMWQRI